MSRLGPTFSFRCASTPLLLVVMAVLSAPFATGLVLCICHDGHVSIEANNCNPSVCCPADICDEQSPAPVALDTSSTHPCVDLVLDSAYMPARETWSSNTLLPLPTALHGFPAEPESTFGLGSAAGGISSQAAHREPAALTHLRTVVLTV